MGELNDITAPLPSGKNLQRGGRAQVSLKHSPLQGERPASCWVTMGPSHDSRMPPGRGRSSREDVRCWSDHVQGLIFPRSF